MAAVNWAKELVAKLEATGTPREKLQPVRDAMADRWTATAALDGKDASRHLTAAEALGLLAAKLGDDHGTVKKARQFIETGSYAPPPPPVDPADLIPLPPDTAEDEPAKRVEDDDRPEAPKPGKAKKGGKKKFAGDDRPGVLEPNADLETIGPKPVEDE